MIIILFGPSGVGKTTIMNRLSSTYGWKVVPTFHTRDVRENENEKIGLLNSEFDKLSKLKFFYSEQHTYNSKYGQPKYYIDEAIHSSDNWVFDLSINQIGEYAKLSRKQCLKIIIKPKFKEQLIEQLIVAGRESRSKEALNDLRNNYSEHDNSFHSLYNSPNDLTGTINKIIKLTNKFDGKF